MISEKFSQFKFTADAFSSRNIIIPYNTHSLGKIQKLMELKSKQRILETLEFGKFVFIICIAISIVGIRSASDGRIIGAGPISEFTPPKYPESNWIVNVTPL